MSELTVPLGTYLFKRLNQVGTEHVFGCPGDFNLKLLDHIYNVDGIEWVGTCNELNAAYAADGYAREASVPGALVTTFGVGELSALNGISGASAENVPVLHIVGQSQRFAQDGHILLHHSTAPHGLKPNDHTAYERMSAPVNAAMEKLWDPKRAPDQIDSVLKTIIRLKEPGTLFIPLDMVNLQVPAENLSHPIKAELPVHPATDEVADKIVDAFSKSKRPVILNDLFATRFNMRDRTHNLLDRTGAYGYVTFLGRSSIDETHPHFAGLYNGHVSFEGIVDAVENQSDFVLNIGAHVSDFNSGSMSRDIPDEKLIIVHAFYCKVFGKNYDNVFFGHVLDRVLERLPAHPGPQVDQTPPRIVKPNPELTGPITQIKLPHVLTKFLRPKDTLIAETGTYQYGSRATDLPADAKYYAQYYYSCIGFALPAAFGSALGKRVIGQTKQRVHLVEGDGSAMMTIQEMASMVRHKVPITMYLINNTGYSIERCIWGPNQDYNDIPANWQWTKLFETFGADPKDVQNFKVTSLEELSKLAEKKDFVDSDKLQLVEIIMDKFDYPITLRQNVVVGAAWGAYKTGEWQLKAGHK